MTVRRADVARNVPAERAIRAAVDAVEMLGADPLLTEAVILLDRARNKVADFVDRAAVDAATRPPSPVYSHPRCVFHYCPHPETCKASPVGCVNAPAEEGTTK